MVSRLRKLISHSRSVNRAKSGANNCAMRFFSGAAFVFRRGARRQEGRRFREHRGQQRQQDQGNEPPHDKDSGPAKRRQQPGRDDTDQNIADLDAAGHRHYQRALPPLGREIRQQRDRGRNAAANPKPGDEARNRQPLGVMDEGGRQRHHAEQGDTAHQHGLASQPVAQPAAQERTQKEADAARRQRRGKGDGPQMPGFRQGRKREGHGAEIESFQHQHRRAKKRDTIFPAGKG